ncbi:unnamed protein product [Adineta steineri]|uniref:Poly [ADP-ribose] polymerase n=1 Tax=Adineta steineri TaxID=433720 RepID=A0A818K506_9BILA|nr:unnamed protein product [Adineta steineri]
MASSRNPTTLSNLNIQWEWEGDKGVWQQFPLDVQQQISQAFNAGNKEVTINQTEEISMTIKFTDMIQINQKTKFMRRLRLCIEFADKNSLSVYEYENESKKWLIYNAEITIKIAHAIENHQTTLLINNRNQSYEVDLEELTETNSETKAVRKIRRVKSMAKIPLAVSTSSNKRSLNFDDQLENTKKKPIVSKSAPTEKSASKPKSTPIEESVSKPKTAPIDKSASKPKSAPIEESASKSKTAPIEKSASKSKTAPTEETTSKPKTAPIEESASKSKPAPKEKSASKSKPAPIEKSAMRTITTVVGKVPVDSECASMSGKAHVYCEDKDVFDCMLNQTDVGNNNNKFYLIQLLEENNSKKYYVWLRWGRVGYNGQNNLEHFGCDLDDAKRFFCKKFSDKTKNDFYYRDAFTKYPGKYDYVQLDYNPSNKLDENNKTQLATIEQLKGLPVPESKLDQRIQNLIQLICNVRAMEEALLEMKFDARKNPLGKLSATQIKAGYSSLKEIEAFIKTNKFNSAFIEANNIYYTRIPHEFGRNTPPLIKTIQQLKSEIELLEALDDIEIAFTTLNIETNTRLNPIDQHYEQLKCKLNPIDKTKDIHKIISKYLQTTHASTHEQYKMQIEDIFEIERENENEVFKDVGNKMLLWHGSRLTNFAGIMSQGLRIAPPEAPVTGYMFGKGLYFADMSSKSANYCYPTPSKNTGLVLLSEVALGKCNELLNADNNAHRLPDGFSSVKGLGSIAPNLKNAVTLDNDVVIPMGPSESTDVNNPKGYTLNYNEYIVYDTKQVRMRYVIKLKFLFK